MGDDDDSFSLTVLVLPLLTPKGEGQRVVLDFGGEVETIDVPPDEDAPVARSPHGPADRRPR